MKAIVTADNHLNKYYNKMRPNQLEDRRQQLAEQFGRVVDHAIETDADLFLHCGDLFDMPNPRNPPVSYVGEKLVELHQNEIATFLVVGNHDKPKMRTAAGGSSPQNIYDAFNVSRVFGDAAKIQTETLTTDAGTVVVGGISHNPLLPDGADPLAETTFNPEADLSILLTHYAIEGHLAGRTNEPIISHASIDAIDPDVLCAGHIHRHRDFMLGGTQLIVPGGTERLDFGEREHETGFYEITWDGKNVGAEYIPLDPQPMVDVIISSHDLKTENPTEIVLQTIADKSSSDQLFRLTLEGTLAREEYHQLALHSIWDFGRERNFYFDLVDDIEFEIGDRIEHSGERLSQVDELERVADQLETAAEDETDAELVREARELVISDYGGGQ